MIHFRPKSFLVHLFLISMLLFGNLGSIELHNNKLKGSIPTTLYASNIETLRLGGNDLEGVIRPEIAQMVNLRHLMLGDSKMGGTIPSEVYRLQYLTELALHNADFGGELSEDFSLLNRTIEVILLDNNNFSGPVPAAFDVCEELRE